MKLVLVNLSKYFLDLILDKYFTEEFHGIILGKDVVVDSCSDIDKLRRTLNLNSLVGLYFKFRLRKSQDKYKSRHYNHQLDWVWKSEGTILSNAKQLKVNFQGPKVFSGEEWSGAQNFPKNKSCQNDLEPKWPHRSHRLESSVTCFAQNRHRMLLETWSVHFVKQAKNITSGW